MEPFVRLQGIAAPLDEANIDTNQLCPTRFNKVPEGERFAEILLHDRRYNADGSEKGDFILNQAPYRRAKIVVSGRNFGVGSSRETAVFGLRFFGIRCVISESFGDIFAENCYKNAILPIVLGSESVAQLMAALKAQPGAEIAVDLEAQVVTSPVGAEFSFEVRPLRKRCMLRGLTDVALTLEYRDRIEQFELAYMRDFDWLP